ncbi:transposase [Streptomyces sp. NPDC003077]|uniref:transposase n=1 Tax=Streptomyces sp. NPDC003077 TaxID=3154443 RepID=UPI0033B40263
MLEPPNPRRAIINALAYWVRAGCAWRLLPHDVPPYQTVCHDWPQWRIEGRWEEMLAACGPGNAPARGGSRRRAPG